MKTLLAAGAIAAVTLAGGGAAKAGEIEIGIGGPGGYFYFGAPARPAVETTIVETWQSDAVPVADLYERDRYGEVRRGPGYYEPPPLPPIRRRHVRRRHGSDYRYRDRACLSRWRVRRRLRRHGWYGFHNLVIRRYVVKVNAHRSSGLLYRLKVDRCTGVILKAQLLERHRRRHYRFSRRFGER